LRGERGGGGCERKGGKRSRPLLISYQGRKRQEWLELPLDLGEEGRRGPCLRGRGERGLTKLPREERRGPFPFSLKIDFRERMQRRSIFQRGERGAT